MAEWDILLESRVYRQIGTGVFFFLWVRSERKLSVPMLKQMERAVRNDGQIVSHCMSGV